MSESVQENDTTSSAAKSPSKRPTVTFTNEEDASPPAPLDNNLQEHDEAATVVTTPVVVLSSMKQDNPQEAYSPQGGRPADAASIFTAVGEQQLAPQTSTTTTRKPRKTKKGWKRRRKGRPVRVAAVSEDETTASSKNSETKSNTVSPPLLSTQYETTLRRRAIRKEGQVPTIAPSPPSRGIFGSNNIPATQKEVRNNDNIMEGYDEEVGDTSLGMKLNILGGRVIVQAVNALSDGRASPAQLTGLVKRGDVLLSIDDNSIVNLPLDHLVVGLKPLSTPQDDGSYQRILRLRFSAGEGLEALVKHDDASKSPGEQGVFSLTQFLPQDFPMVDQMSGLPMFDDATTSPQREKLLKPVVATPLMPPQGGKFNQPVVVDPSAKKLLSLNELISLGVANLLRNEKEHFMSQYFAWNDNYSELLRPVLVATVRAGEEITAFLNKKKELIEQGEEAMKGARMLSLNMEDIDKGKDLRSFQAWSSNASLRSRASTRRRYVMDAASVIGSTIWEEAGSELAVSVGSEEAEDMDDLDGDDLLIELAAHDEIWRKQVLETIINARTEMEEDDKENDEEPEKSNTNNVDIAEKLGSLFLGEQVNKLLTKKKKSYALPQDEVTCVLFDLVTHLASTTPDEISVKGNFDINPQTSLVPFQRSKSATVERDALLATLFVVNEVFPAWLSSFKPLPWEERRVLWPHTKASNIGSTAGGSLGDDLLTIDSFGASPAPVRKRKNLRETIEDMELDVESRAETCFLTSFYFTQEILPGMSTNGCAAAGGRNKKSFTESDALEFVDKYGAYLKLPMAMAYAAFLKSEPVIVKLLELAKHDPRHLEALKEISRVNSLILYEPTMLSAITKRVRTIGHQKLEGRSHLIHLAVSAFPDVRPWIVRKGCLEDDNNDHKKKEDLGELYFVYLSLLLHPSDGHDAARQDTDLVKEWCELSVQGEKNDDAYSRSRRNNFVIVASRKQPEYKMYRRDLPFLMDLAVKVGETALALELIDEMLDYKRYVVNEELMSRILLNLRKIATDSLGSSSMFGSKPMKHLDLKRSFRLLEKIFSSQQRCVIIGSISVSGEYDSLILSCDSKARPELLELLASNAEPLYTLQSLKGWSRDHKSAADFLPILRLSLKRSASLRNRKELSPALLRFKKARAANFEEEQKTEKKVDGVKRGKGMLWRLMMSGDLKIDK